MLSDQRFDLYEEPVPFDWFEETKQVADAVDVPVGAANPNQACVALRGKSRTMLFRSLSQTCLILVA